MLDLNNVNLENNNTQSFELIPDRTIVRAVIKLVGGEVEKQEFGSGNYFKRSANTGSTWLPMEFTIIGGPHDRRKVWENIFVDGPKLNANGVSIAKEIGIRTLRQIVDSEFNIKSTDNSPEASAKRNLAGVHQLDNLEFCFRAGIQKADDNYPAKNRLGAVITPDMEGYIVGNQQTVAPANPVATPVVQTNTTATAGSVPEWAK